jgi:hypothetical protein
MSSQQTPYQSSPAPYQTVSEQQRRIWRTKGKRAIGFGIGWIAFGLIFSIISYQAAANGGVYFVAYGPVIFGVYRLILGITLLNKANR